LKVVPTTTLGISLTSNATACTFVVGFFPSVV
jgi:hypothetical protein